jgi:WD40 repeat protein
VLAFSLTDSNLLASGGRFGELKLWNVKEQACIYSFGEHSYVPTGEIIIPSLLFTGGGSSSVCINAMISSGSIIRIWREEGSSEFTREIISIPGLIQRNFTGVYRPAFSPCGSFFTIAYVVESGTTITSYELETMTKSQSVALPDFFVTDSGVASVSPDSKTLVHGNAQGRIRLLQIDDFSIQRDLNTRRGPPMTTIEEKVQCVAFDPTCRVFVMGGHVGRLELWTL